MFLVELCHKVQPAATGLVSELVQEEGDAAAVTANSQGTQEGTSAFGLTSLAQTLEGMEIPTCFNLKEILAQLDGTTVLAVAPAGTEGAWPA